MSFTLWAVIAESIQKRKTGSSLKLPPVVIAPAMHGRDRRSGCTPAEPYPPEACLKVTKNFESCHPQ
jgi:hypothetical protein